MADKVETPALAVRVRRGVHRYIPEFLVLLYHYILAVVALVVYRNPSRDLVVIGVTGTKGKTTTALFIYATLSAAGNKVGLLSTVATHIGDKVYPNSRHMTMPGRGFVQQQLRKMVNAGCTYVVIETPSEGIRQYRDLGVRYDSVVFTNLAVEHLVTHRTFERYRATKCRLFTRHAKGSPKSIQGSVVPRFVLLNADDMYLDYFRACSASSHSEQILFGFGTQASVRIYLDEESDTNSFFIEGDRYTVPFPGAITVRNALPAIFLAKRYCNASESVINTALTSIVLPGRLECIDEGQPFKVFCDYAHEPLSIASVCDALKKYVGPGGKIIIVVGAVGASRWKYNARQIGETATTYAHTTVITNVDPFFDDPQVIINAVVEGAKKNRKAHFVVKPDRREAIHTALSLARGGDVVIVTGKGAELTIEVCGQSLPWDERGIIRQSVRDVIAERSESSKE